MNFAGYMQRSERKLNAYASLAVPLLYCSVKGSASEEQRVIAVEKSTRDDDTKVALRACLLPLSKRYTTSVVVSVSSKHIILTAYFILFDIFK